MGHDKECQDHEFVQQKNIVASCQAQCIVAHPCGDRNKLIRGAVIELTLRSGKLLLLTTFLPVGVPMLHPVVKEAWY